VFREWTDGGCEVLLSPVLSAVIFLPFRAKTFQALHIEAVNHTWHDINDIIMNFNTEAREKEEKKANSPARGCDL
jgi:hypothetical protein